MRSGNGIRLFLSNDTMEVSMSIRCLLDFDNLKTHIRQHFTDLVFLIQRNLVARETFIFEALFTGNTNYKSPPICQYTIYLCHSFWSILPIEQRIDRAAFREMASWIGQ